MKMKQVNPQKKQPEILNDNSEKYHHEFNQACTDINSQIDSIAEQLRRFPSSMITDKNKPTESIKNQGIEIIRSIGKLHLNTENARLTVIRHFGQPTAEYTIEGDLKTLDAAKETIKKIDIAERKNTQDAYSCIETLEAIMKLQDIPYTKGTASIFIQNDKYKIETSTTNETTIRDLKHMGKAVTLKPALFANHYTVITGDPSLLDDIKAYNAETIRNCAEEKHRIQNNDIQIQYNDQSF